MEIYGNGSNLPWLHPSKDINGELLIQVLCGNLDAARRALLSTTAECFDPDFVANAAWALKETDPARILPRSAQYGNDCVDDMLKVKEYAEAIRQKTVLQLHDKVKLERDSGEYYVDG